MFIETLHPKCAFQTRESAFVATVNPGHSQRDVERGTCLGGSLEESRGSQALHSVHASAAQRPYDLPIHTLPHFMPVSTSHQYYSFTTQHLALNGCDGLAKDAEV